MTVAELIERLKACPQDALVLRAYDSSRSRREYVETNDWLDVIEVQQSKPGAHGKMDYHWWERDSRDSADDKVFRDAVVL